MIVRLLTMTEPIELNVFDGIRVPHAYLCAKIIVGLQFDLHILFGNIVVVVNAMVVRSFDDILDVGFSDELLEI